MAGRVSIDIERCKGCGLCVWACSKDVLEMGFERTNAKGYYYPVVVGDDCSACAQCGIVCPDVCIGVCWENGN